MRIKFCRSDVSSCNDFNVMRDREASNRRLFKVEGGRTMESIVFTAPWVWVEKYGALNTDFVEKMDADLDEEHPYDFN